MPGLQSRECQQCGVTTVQMSFPDLTTVPDALYVQETSSDTHHESFPNSFEESSTSIASLQPRETSPNFPSASSSRERQTVYHKSSPGVLAVMKGQGHCSPHFLAHDKAVFCEST